MPLVSPVSAEQVTEALAIGATNSMYNVLFKFRDISGTDVFDGMSVGLRAHTFQGTSLDDMTVELINLSLSDINGCKPCTAAHVQKARQTGLSDEAIFEDPVCGNDDCRNAVSQVDWRSPVRKTVIGERNP